MPSHRKRIGFLPSEKIQEIIDKLCRANEFSQSKVTGLLVEEALRSRGVLSDSFASNNIEELKFNNFSFEQEQIFKNNKFQNKGDNYTVNNKTFSDNIKMMHEFVEFKYFKKVMKQNNNIIE
tara:strand:+ start:65 stop:430 length:366 start_codon:yes stop_codon:yes gene_type:complete